MALPMGDYDVVLNVADSHGLEQDNVVQATVCDCTGPDVMCKATRVAAIGLPVILGILGGILLLLCEFNIREHISRGLSQGCSIGHFLAHFQAHKFFVCRTLEAVIQKA